MVQLFALNQFFSFFYFRLKGSHNKENYEYMKLREFSKIFITFLGFYSDFWYCSKLKGWGCLSQHGASDWMTCCVG